VEALTRKKREWKQKMSCRNSCFLPTSTPTAHTSTFYLSAAAV